MFFIAAGYAKLAEPIDTLAQLMRWPDLVAPNLVRGLGLAEIVLAVLLPVLALVAFAVLTLVAFAAILLLAVVIVAVVVVVRLPLALVGLLIAATTVERLAAIGLLVLLGCPLDGGGEAVRQAGKVVVVVLVHLHVAARAGIAHLGLRLGLLGPPAIPWPKGVL